MSDIEEAMRVRQHHRAALLSIKRTVSEMGTDLISTSDAASAGIQQQFMSLNAQPVFFTLFQGKLEPPAEPEPLIFYPETHTNLIGMVHYLRHDIPAPTFTEDVIRRGFRGREYVCPLFF